jgi:hypothetical protein
MATSGFQKLFETTQWLSVKSAGLASIFIEAVFKKLEPKGGLRTYLILETLKLRKYLIRLCL